LEVVELDEEYNRATRYTRQKTMMEDIIGIRRERKRKKKKSNNKCKIARATTVGQKHVGLVLGYIGVSSLESRV
jgi:hypothetical protein